MDVWKCHLFCDHKVILKSKFKKKKTNTRHTPFINGIKKVKTNKLEWSEYC